MAEFKSIKDKFYIVIQILQHSLKLFIFKCICLLLGRIVAKLTNPVNIRISVASRNLARQVHKLYVSCFSSRLSVKYIHRYTRINICFVQNIAFTNTNKYFAMMIKKSTEQINNNQLLLSLQQIYVIFARIINNILQTLYIQLSSILSSLYQKYANIQHLSPLFTTHC